METGQVQPTDHLILRQNDFINIYWLFQLLVTLIHRATHIPGLTALFFVGWLAIVYVWARAIDEILEAPEIPSFVFELALKWAMKRENRGWFERVAALRPKMRSFEQADQEEVDRLLNDRW